MGVRIPLPVQGENMRMIKPRCCGRPMFRIITRLPGRRRKFVSWICVNPACPKGPEGGIRA
jgi:hypothetical protein